MSDYLLAKWLEKEQEQGNPTDISRKRVHADGSDDSKPPIVLFLIPEDGLVDICYNNSGIVSDNLWKLLRASHDESLSHDDLHLVKSEVSTFLGWLFNPEPDYARYLEDFLEFFQGDDEEEKVSPVNNKAAFILKKKGIDHLFLRSIVIEDRDNWKFFDADGWTKKYASDGFKPIISIVFQHQG